MAGVQHLRLNDTHDADYHRDIINDYIHRHTNTVTTLTIAVSIGDTSITVTDSTGFTVGDLIHIGATGEYTERLHPSITNIVGNVITLDRPLDNGYPINTQIILAVIDMSTAAGSLTNPISYKYYPKKGNVEHIKRFIISMTHSAAAADSTFGSISKLTNGVLLRVVINGNKITLTNWKNNADIILDVYDVVYTDKAGPSTYGTRAIGSFINLDAVVSLISTQDDYIEILIQDNITALDGFFVKVQGHIEGV